MKFNKKLIGYIICGVVIILTLFFSFSSSGILRVLSIYLLLGVILIFSFPKNLEEDTKTRSKNSRDSIEYGANSGGGSKLPISKKKNWLDCAEKWINVIVVVICTFLVTAFKTCSEIKIAEKEEIRKEQRFEWEKEEHKIKFEREKEEHKWKQEDRKKQQKEEIENGQSS